MSDDALGEGAIQILARGPDGVQEWNCRRADNPDAVIDLTAVNLSQCNLAGANLSRARARGAQFRGSNMTAADLRNADLLEANFAGADLGRANLRSARLEGANLYSTNLRNADLSACDLTGADLGEARMRAAVLQGATLRGTNFAEADLSDSRLRLVNLSNANLSDADLSGADLGGAQLDGAILRGTIFDSTILGNLDLSTIQDSLKDIFHRGPSTIGTDTLLKSKGRVPEEFLRGCGLSPWEATLACLYDRQMNAGEICDLFSARVLPAMTGGPISIGGVFISYSHADHLFAEKMRAQLYQAGASVWLDRHDLKAGDLQKQIGRAIRLHDIVLLILSKNSVSSDWVEHELSIARSKERAESRDVLCPIALDGLWKQKVEDDTLWRQLKRKVVLDFSGWETADFHPQFAKLIEGLKLNYNSESRRHG